MEPDKYAISFAVFIGDRPLCICVDGCEHSVEYDSKHPYPMRYEGLIWRVAPVYMSMLVCTIDAKWLSKTSLCFWEHHE